MRVRVRVRVRAAQDALEHLGRAEERCGCGVAAVLVLVHAGRFEKRGLRADLAVGITMCHFLLLLLRRRLVLGELLGENLGVYLFSGDGLEQLD